MAGEHTRGGGCGSIGFDAVNLTRVDSRMKVTLTGLPDKLRAVAWPSSARTLRRAVKSVNERDPHHHLRPCFTIFLISNEHGYYDETAAEKVEEGVVNDRSVWREYPRLHAAYNGWDNAMQHRKVKLIA